MDNKKPFFNIAVFAHNEENNIGFLLDELLRQAESMLLPFNITVIASGCSDRTEDIIKAYNNNRINLLIEKQRRGKARAINLFLSQARVDLLVISSADIIPADNTLKKLIGVFSDPLVGMAGGRPLPKTSSGIVGLLNRLLWELHHEVALCRPKLGEFIVIRNIIDGIPDESAADEAAMEALIIQKGFKIKYLPQAIIYNYGPKNLISFVKRRIRIFVGHLFVKQSIGYKVSTYNAAPLIVAVIKKIKKEKKNTFYILILVCLETYARIIGFLYFFIRKKTFSIWGR